MVVRGSQIREELEASGYELLETLADGEVVLLDMEGKEELWVENDDYAGYVVVINGVGHEFVCTLSAPHVFSERYSQLRPAYA